jgi:hypothetical protein
MNSDNPLDYLRSLAALLSEYDTYQQLNNPDASVGARGRMGAMFKSGMRGVKGRRSSSVAIESLSESVESAQLEFIPMPPISSGNLPEFTYLQTPSLPFDPDFHTAFATLADILIDTYSGVVQLLPNAESIGPGVGEAFGKADKILRKVLVQNATQELGDTTRREVRTEIGGLSRLVLGGLMWHLSFAFSFLLRLDEGWSSQYLTSIMIRLLFYRATASGGLYHLLEAAMTCWHAHVMLSAFILF